MGSERLGSTIGVAFLQSADDGRVLFHRLLHAAVGAELHATEGTEADLELAGLGGEEAISRGLVDEAVKFLVQVKVIVGVHLCLALTSALLYGGNVFIARTAGRLMDAEGLELRHDLEHFDELGNPRIADIGTAALDELDGDQNRLACAGPREEGARNAKLGGQANLVETLAVLELTFDDALLEALPDGVGAVGGHSGDYRNAVVGTNP